MFEKSVAGELSSGHSKKAATESILGRISVVAGHSHPDAKSRGARIDGEMSDSTLILDQSDSLGFSEYCHSTTSHSYSSKRGLHSVPPNGSFLFALLSSKLSTAIKITSKSM